MRLLTTGLMIIVLGLTACGRKGKLERADPGAETIERGDSTDPLDRLRTRGL